MINKLYYIFYGAMIIGYIGVSFQAVDLRTKVIGILLTIVNGLIFWR
jgi:hypothetical protein